MDIQFKAIGTIHTPYFSFNTPHQPVPDAPGDFWITLNPDYAGALQNLDSFSYIIVLYYLDQVTAPAKFLTNTPWAPEKEVGLFASRSPLRPNPIGLSIVKVKEIQGNDIIISGIDAYNGTPLLDIKPYMHFLDSKEDSNNGWFDELPDKDHLIAHALGLSHDHDQHHSHEHDHVHNHNSNHHHQDAHEYSHEDHDRDQHHEHEHKHVHHHHQLDHHFSEHND